MTNQPKEESMLKTTAIAFVGLLLLVSALWGLPPPSAGDPVELAWIQAASHVAEGVNERQAPAAQTNIGQIKTREHPRDGGVMLTTHAAADWTLPPSRASPQSVVA